jgi:hypothetical protein
MLNKEKYKTFFHYFWLFIVLTSFSPFNLFCYVYKFSNEPIDVIIPCAKKDVPTLELCIKGIRDNGKNIRKIIVISSERLTNNADWFDENKFPFSNEDIANEIYGNNENMKKSFITTRAGWLLQQFLKLYSVYVIPGISENILVLDADTIFLKPVEFQNNDNEPLFAYGKENHTAYFETAKILLPYFSKVYKEYSGIAHHMLFQKSILEYLFNEIQKYNNEEPWKAICHAISKRISNRGFFAEFSEYELYFNFVFLTTNQGHIRILKHYDISSLNQIPSYQKDNYSYVSAHTWRRHN